MSIGGVLSVIAAALWLGLTFVGGRANSWSGTARFSMALALLSVAYYAGRSGW